jgi:hypothetical protein
MDISPSTRRKLFLISGSLVLTALVLSVGAALMVGGNRMDWPLTGIVVATLLATAASLLGPDSPTLHRALTWLSMSLTFPCAAVVLVRIFGGR